MSTKFILLSLFVFVNIWSSTIKANRGMIVVPKQEKRIALVIGNNNYQYLKRLDNAVKDSNDIGKILSLKKLGFSVSYLKNSSRREMLNSLKVFYNKINHGAVGLLYYAGHGVEFQGKNYLLPIEVEREKIDVEDNAISLNTIIRRMKEANSQLNIIILDACRNDPFNSSRAIGSEEGGLAKVNPPSGLFIAYAADEGQISSDGRKGENGLFTKYLKYYIQQPLSLEKVFEEINKQVLNDSTLKPKQSPVVYNHVLNNDFYFIPPTNNTVIPHFKTQPANAKIDIKGIGTWSKGMSLKKGDYTLIISSAGLSKVFKININSNELFIFKLNPVHREDKKDQDIPEDKKYAPLFTSHCENTTNGHACSITIGIQRDVGGRIVKGIE